MKFIPHPYQQYAIDRIINQANVGLFLDMGLGKTVITLTAIDRLIHDWGIVRRVLIIAPKKVAEATWQAEVRKWDHLRGLTIATALGTADERRRAVEAGAEITVINRENVVWLVDSLSRAKRDSSLGRAKRDNSLSRAKRDSSLGEGAGGGWPFDMVVVDESSSFKSPSAKRFKALRRMLPKIRSVVILTGTPAPNGIMDLWSQIYLLDRGARLGKYVTHYRSRYFDHNPWRHEYIPKPGAFEAVQKRISDICVSMKAEDWIQLPEMIVQDVPVVLEGAGLKAYREMEKTMVMEVGERGTTSSVSADALPPSPEGEGIEISATTAAALTGKLLQLCGGCVYDEAGQAHHVHDAKLEALGELIEGLNGEHALLFYGFRHELPGIRAKLCGVRWRELNSAEDAEAWNRGEVDVLLAHPASCAYGLNLQDGGHHVIWYTLTWSLELYQQANARLHRQGQEKPVIVHRLLVQGGVDEDVAKALEGKDETQAALVEALKARIERWSG